MPTCEKKRSNFELIVVATTPSRQAVRILQAALGQGDLACVYIYLFFKLLLDDHRFLQTYVRFRYKLFNFTISAAEFSNGIKDVNARFVRSFGNLKREA